MSRRKQSVDKGRDRPERHRAEPSVAAEQARDLAEPLAGPLADAGNGSIQRQAARLSDRQVQAAQRQTMATQIGQRQGNHHLHRVVSSIQRTEEPAPSREVPGLPQEVVDAAQANLTDDPQAAIDVIVQALVERGRISLSHLEGRTVRYDPSLPPGDYGHTSESPGTGAHRRSRVVIGPAALRNVSLLYSTLMHEYQHVLQHWQSGETWEHSLERVLLPPQFAPGGLGAPRRTELLHAFQYVRRRRPGRQIGEAAGEVEAYLWEIEHLEQTGAWRDSQYMGHLQGLLEHWWVQMTPQERAPLQGRYDGAQDTLREMRRRLEAHQLEAQRSAPAQRASDPVQRARATVARDVVTDAERRVATLIPRWAELSASQGHAILSLIRTPSRGGEAVQALWRAIRPPSPLAVRTIIEVTPNLGVVGGERVATAGMGSGLTLAYVNATPECPRLRHNVRAAPQEGRETARQAHREHHRAGASATIHAMIQVNPNVFHTDPAESVANLHSLLMHEYAHVEQIVGRGIHDGIRFVPAGSREFLNERSLGARQRAALGALDEIEANCAEIENATRTGLDVSFNLRNTLDYLWSAYVSYHDSLADPRRDLDRRIARRVYDDLVAGSRTLIAYLDSDRASWLSPALRQRARRPPQGYEGSARRKILDYL